MFGDGSGAMMSGDAALMRDGDVEVVLFGRRAEWVGASQIDVNKSRGGERLCADEVKELRKGRWEARTWGCADVSDKH